MNSSELQNAWRENVVKRRRSDETASLNSNFLSPTMNVNVTPRNRANLRRLKTNSLQSFKRWEKENELLYAMIEDLSEWLKKLFAEVVMTPDFFFFALEDGSLLCRLANYIQEKVNVYGAREGVAVPGRGFRYNNTPVQRRGTKEQQLFRARENVQLYLTWCRSHGFPEAILFESNDVVEVDECREGGREIVICLMELARRFKKYNLDEVPRLIQMEQEIDQEEQDPNEHVQSFETQISETTSPTSVDSGVDSVFDEDSTVNRMSEVSTDATDGANKERKPRAELPSLLDSTGPKSQLDEQVCKIAKDYNIKVVQRLKEGKYIILGRIMFVRMLNDHLLLRIGGGWDTLEHYLMTHAPKPGADTCSPLRKGASPRTSRNSTVKSRARLFEPGNTNGATPRRNPVTRELPAVVVSNAESAESPPKDDKAGSPGRRLSEFQKDERDISEAIRKISSTVLGQKKPSFANKTFFLLKKRFGEKGIFSKVRRRDSEPILGDAKLLKQMAETGSLETLAHSQQEINANEVGQLKENGDPSVPDILVQTKVADTSCFGNETNLETRAELASEDANAAAPSIDITPADATNQQQERDSQPLVSFDEEAPNPEAPATGNDVVAAADTPAEANAQPKSEDLAEGEGGQRTKEAQKIKAELGDEGEKQAGSAPPATAKGKEGVTKGTTAQKKKEEVKKGVAKPGAVESGKPKPKAAVAGRPKSPTKLPGKTESKPATKREVGAKSAAAKAPGAAKKPEPKKADERPRSAAPRLGFAKKEPSAKPAPAKTAPAPRRPAGAAPKPAVAVAPRKTAPTTRPTSGAAPRKPATSKPGSAARPAPGGARPQSAKPGTRPTDKTDGQAAGKPARPQSAAAKPRAPASTARPGTASGLARPKPATTKLPSMAKSDAGAKKSAEVKPTARPGSARPGAPKTSTKAPAAQKPSSAAAKPRVGGVKAPAQKGKEAKPAGSLATKKPAAKKEKPAAATKEIPPEPTAEPKPTLSEAAPSLEAPPAENVVREDKSETVEVEGDVVVKTVVTTREVVTPEGETQITTTTEKFTEQTVVREVPETEVAKEAAEISPVQLGGTSDDQRTSPEPVPSGNSPAEKETAEDSSETPVDTIEDQRSSPEPVPKEESPAEPELVKDNDEETEQENLANTAEDLRSSPEPVPKEESPAEPDVVENNPDEIPANLAGTTGDLRSSPEPMSREESPPAEPDESVTENLQNTSEDQRTSPEPVPREESPAELQVAESNPDDHFPEGPVDTSEDQPSSPEPMSSEAKDDENLVEKPDSTEENLFQLDGNAAQATDPVEGDGEVPTTDNLIDIGV